VRSSGPAHANCSELKNVTLDVQFVTDVVLPKEDTYSQTEKSHEPRETRRAEVRDSLMESDNGSYFNNLIKFIMFLYQLDQNFRSFDQILF